jgi:CBS domain-containing protein
MAKKVSLRSEVFNILKSRKKAAGKKRTKEKVERAATKTQKTNVNIATPNQARQIKPAMKKQVKAVANKVIIGTVKIRDIMIPGPKTLDENDNLGNAADMFFRDNIDGAPVLSRNKLVGIINKSDILRILGKNDITVKDIKAMGSTAIRGVMRRPFTIREDETLTQAVKAINKNNIERLAVVDKKGTLTGIVTRTDVMKGIMRLFFDVMQKEMGNVIETDIDKILNMVTTKVSISKIAKETGMKEDHIEELARILEEHGLIKIDYPAIGKPVLRRV